MRKARAGFRKMAGPGAGRPPVGSQVRCGTTAMCCGRRQMRTGLYRLELDFYNPQDATRLPVTDLRTGVTGDKVPFRSPTSCSAHDRLLLRSLWRRRPCSGPMPG